MSTAVRLSEALIAEYNQAYAAANGKDAPVLLYKRGWFELQVSGYTQRFRRKNIEAMRDALRFRAAGRAALTAPDMGGVDVT